MINGPAGYDPIQGGMRTEMKAGPGIDISHGTISTTGEAGVPYVGGTGIYIHGATVEADLDPGYRMEINGSTIGQMRYMPVEIVTGNSVTMQAGHAYKIYATSAAITLNTETIPANSFGLEGHLEIFVAGTGYVVTGSNVVLANALEPDAVNNCTVRFHDGLAIISVEDHVAGYIVTVNAASGAGSLAYGLSTATNEYISVDASLNGQTLDLAGATTYAGEKHVVGNGYTETIISGDVNCTSKTTFSNLSMDGVSVNGGTMTLGDVYIPEGATVTVSGGGLAVEKVTGDGGTIDLGSTKANIPSVSATASGCVFSGSAIPDGVIHGYRRNLALTGCTLVNSGGAFSVILTGDSATDTGHLTLDSCIVSAGAISLIDGGDCTVVSNFRLKTAIAAYPGNAGGKVIITSGAVIDLTGNNYTTTIAPGGGITFASGGATVLYGSSGGAVSSSFIAGATVTAIGNNGALVGNSSAPVITGYENGAIISGVKLTGGTDYWGGVGRVGGKTATFIDCVISGNTTTQTGDSWNALTVAYGGSAIVSNCSFATNPAQGIIESNGAHVTLAGSNHFSYRIYIQENSVLSIADGAIVDFTGNSYSNPLVFADRSDCVVVADGDPTKSATIITSAGASVSIAGGTYTKINNDGTTE